jgi:hypothetical protein
VRRSNAVARARSKKPAKKPSASSITIAIVGEGVTPKDIGLRELAALLEATATTFEAIADEKNIETPRLSLARVKNGSAAYELASQDRQAPKMFNSFRATVRKRGKNSSPRIRYSLARLHSVATKSGAGLRVEPEVGEETAAPIMLAPPLPEDEARIEEGTVAYARVVGIKLDARDHATVTLRYDDGGHGDFDADADLVEAAARMIGRNVSARVTFQRGESKDFDGALESLEERATPADLMDAIGVARTEIESKGIEVDAEAWWAEEREDE